MMHRRLATSASLLVLAAGMVLAPAQRAWAQEMGQGEAHITARSNVQMEVQGGPGTTSRKLAEMSGALGGVLGQVRDCYAEVLRERPTVQGTMRVRVSVGDRGRAEAEITVDGVEDPPLARCVVQAAERGDYQGIQPPVSAVLALVFTNTAAEGVERMNERSAEEAQHAVSTDADGHPVAGFGTPGGEVRYEVTGQGNTSAEAVVSVVGDLRSHVAQMLDCRRRATRSGSDPAGELAYHLWIPARGAVRTRQVTNTVEHAVGGRCMSTALARARFAPASAGHVLVRIHFAPMQPEATPTPPPSAAGATAPPR